MQTRVAKKNKKQVYNKPELRIIELAAEEVLANGCKMLGRPDGANGQAFCGISNNCSQAGS